MPSFPPDPNPEALSAVIRHYEPEAVVEWQRRVAEILEESGPPALMIAGLADAPAEAVAVGYLLGCISAALGIAAELADKLKNGEGSQVGDMLDGLTGEQIASVCQHAHEMLGGSEFRGLAETPKSRGLEVHLL